MKVATKSLHVRKGQTVEPTPVNVRRNFEAACRGMYVKGLALERLIADWPANEPPLVTPEFSESLAVVIQGIKELGKID